MAGHKAGPGQADALLRQAEERLAAGDAAAALTAADQALRLVPNHPNAHTQRGSALLRLGRPVEAATAFQAAIRLYPDLAALHLLAGNAFRAAGDHQAAADCYLAAAQRDPAQAGIWHNLGLSRRGLSDLAGAARALRRACALAPTAAAHWNALGSALHAGDQGEHAIRAWRWARHLDAAAKGVEWRRAGWNLSQALLRQGAMAEGWALHHHRPSYPGNPVPPILDRMPQPGEHVYITVEQGLGDIIMALRFIPLLLAAGGVVSLQCPAPLAVLMRGGWFDQVTLVPEGQGPPLACIGQIPCMSLPGLFVSDADHVPGEIPYLQPDPARVAAVRERLAGATGLRVGFVWAGNPDFAADRERSPGLAPLLPLLNLPGLTPILLQQGAGRGDLERLQVPAHAIDLGAGGGDLADLAAALTQIDLLVTSCTMPAHLAGALGVEMAVLLAHVADWRWLDRRPDSPWYPTARLYRQPSPGDWSGVVAALGADLTLRIGKKKSVESA